MKICLISPFFYPEPISTGKYNTILAQKLKEGGAELTVFASHPIYPDWKVSRSSDLIDGISIVRGGENISYPKSATLRRAILEFWFTAFILKNVVFSRKNYDRYVLIFPPSLFAILFNFFSKKNQRIIGIVHDLQGVYAKKSKSIPGKFLQWAIKYVEKKAFDRCEHIIFLSDSMLECAAQEYNLNRKKCSVNYPFVALPQNIPEHSKNSLLPEEEISSEKFNFVYSGALGQKQNPSGLAKLMIRLSEILPDVDFHIFSAGPFFEEIKLQNKNSKIRFHGLVATEHLNELYRRSKIQIIPQANETADGSLPSKLPNLIASNTPIFAICEKNTELEILLSKLENTAICNTWELDDLTTVALRFIENLKNTSEQEIGSARIKILKKFSINDLTQKILSNEGLL